MEASTDSVPLTGPQGRQDVPLPLVFGRYLLVQRLSRGGMGEIFLAKHGLAGFEKLAVIKKVLPHLAADAQFISRFVDEAQVAIKLQHVNVAQVFEVGRVGDEYFLALEYIEGRDLRRTIGILAQRKARLPVDLALFIGRELANGLAYAHRRTTNDGSSLNLVHCDISPPNVLVSFEGETKVIDFGIAKSALRGTATDPKMGFGKFGYMAPEQLIRGGVVDHRTDIYAAGVVLFELLTGQRLYEAGPEPDYRTLARKVSRGEHALPSEVEPTLAPYDDLVATALRPRPEDRYQSAAELRDAIQQSLVGINPTISTDQLGAFMRELFADEMLAQKDLHDRVAQAHLADFQAQLTTQAVSTVSFALANAPLPMPDDATRPRSSAQIAARGTSPPDDATGAADARRSSSPASHATEDLSLADGTGTADRVAIDLSEPRPAQRKRTVLIAALMGTTVVAVACAAWLAMRDAGTRPGSAPGLASATGPQAVTAEPIVVAPTSSPTPAPTPTPARTPTPTPTIEIDPVEPTPPPVHVATPLAPSHHHQGSAHAVEHPAPTAPATVTRAAVGAKFSAASREYETFKGKFGMRLDREWNELTMFVQYKLTDSNLDDGMRRIEAFRTKLRD